MIFLPAVGGKYEDPADNLTLKATDAPIAILYIKNQYQLEDFKAGF